MISGPFKALILAILLATLTLGVPVSAAKGPDLLLFHADVMEHQGRLQQKGGLDLLRVSDQETFTTPDLRLEAEALWAVRFTSEHVQVATVRGADAVPNDPEHFGDASSPLRNALMTSSGGDPAFDIRVLSDGRAGTEITARLQGTTALEALPEAQMGSLGGIKDREPGVEDSSTGEEHRAFITRSIDEPVVVSRSHGADGAVRVQGDFIIEVLGIDVTLETGSSNHTIHTGVDNSSESLPAYVIRQSTLRVFVRDGLLEIQQRGINTEFEWAMRSIEVAGDDGQIRMEGSDDGPSEVRFANGYTGVLTPGNGERLDMGLTEEPAGPTASTWLSPDGFNPLPFMIAALVAAVAAVAVLAGRRTPSLSLMERALESGSFLRAARLARRIIRADPTVESAHLGQAIAFSRTGRPERVVQDLESYLDGTEPSDGTLHYVLGLAYRDLGRESAAADALSEAVRRTPALATQIPHPGQPPHPTAPGDAQGYT